MRWIAISLIGVALILQVSAGSTNQLTLLDGRTEKGVGVSFGNDGARVVRAGASPLNVPWHKIDPKSLSEERLEQQFDYVRERLESAIASGGSDREGLNTTLSNLGPLLSAMSPSDREPFRSLWTKAEEAKSSVGELAQPASSMPLPTPAPAVPTERAPTGGGNAEDAFSTGAASPPPNGGHPLASSGDSPAKNDSEGNPLAGLNGDRPSLSEITPDAIGDRWMRFKTAFLESPRNLVILAIMLIFLLLAGFNKLRKGKKKGEDLKQHLESEMMIGGLAGLASCLITGVVILLGWVPMFYLVDVVIIVFLSFGVLTYSRIAALVLLIYWIYARFVNWWLVPEAMANSFTIFFTLGFTLAFLGALIASFRYNPFRGMKD